MKRFQEVPGVAESEHKYTYADFTSEPTEFQPPEGSLYRERVAVLEKKVGELEATVAYLRADAKSIDDFFRARIGQLVNEFVEHCREATPPTVEIQQAVEAVFQREANHVAKAILSRIQPYALR